MRGILPGAVLALLSLGIASCKLLDTSDDENVVGRGSTAFDPYDIDSGAVKLGLTLFNGCAILPNGQTVAANSATPAGYPTVCPDPVSRDPSNPPPPGPFGPAPGVPLLLLSGTDYFLNQLSITDVVTNTAEVTDNPETALSWITRSSAFKGLDWSGVGRGTEDFKFSEIEGGWYREVHFAGASWMSSSEDEFLIEILDASGNPRGEPISYSRTEFLGESAAAGHNRISWRAGPALPPAFKGDPEVRPLPADPGGPGGTLPTYRNMVRLDLNGSTNPFKTFRVENYTGEAVIRVTWSLNPGNPWVFPVTFVRSTDIQPTCFNEAGQPSTCTLGLQVRAKLTRPANNLGYYVPGELFEISFDLRDGRGNRLHPPGIFPSYAKMYGGEANGLLYTHMSHWHTLEERDVSSSYQLVGPINELEVYDQTSPAPQYFRLNSFFQSVITDAAAEFPGFKGLFFLDWPAKGRVTLPPDAKPGTYALVVRGNRYFYGERLARTETFFFQVGQPQATSFPGQVGNCQICHRGVISLENLRHGQSVDEIETCKGCHGSVDDFPTRIQRAIHQVHMRSDKYPRNKADCSVCHLNAQSTLRPSLDTCTSCHVSAHGGEFFPMEFNVSSTASRFSNCAQACHGETVPSGHIVGEVQ